MQLSRSKIIIAVVVALALLIGALVPTLIILLQPDTPDVPGPITPPNPDLPTNHAPGVPTGLLTNESLYPMNIQGVPMFDWWVCDEDYDEVQTAYQIRVYDEITDQVVWDSGKVKSSMQNCVPYTGEALKPGYPYSWEVSTWDSSDEQSPFSERARFTTGLTDSDWGAEWIQGIQNDVESPLDIIIESYYDVMLEGDGFALVGEYTDWAEYKLSTELSLVSGSVGIAFRMSADEEAGYVWRLVPGVGLVRYKVACGELIKLGETVATDIMAGNDYTVEITASGGSFATRINGALVDTYTDTEPITSGTFGFHSEAGQKTKIYTFSVSETSSSDSVKELNFGAAGTPRYTAGYEWTDYTMEFDMVINAVAAGVMLRCPDARNGYMWQFNISKGGLARHIQVDNSFTKIDGNGAVSLELVAGQKYHVAITVAENVITTYVDGKLIDTYVDTASTHSAGTFGMRQGSGEDATLSNITITSADGSLLCREAADVASNYSASDKITVTETGTPPASYTADFSESDLAGWITTADTLPISNGEQRTYWARSSGDGVTLLNIGLGWTDYTVSLDIMAEKTSAGLVFRAPDASNTGYMWAVRSDGILRLHKGENNKYVRIGTNSESDLRPGLVSGEAYRLSITVSGDTITTYIDGKLVSTRTSDVSSYGTIGFRTDSNEIGRYTNVVVTDPDGNILFADDFSGGADNWGTSGALNADNSYWYSRKEVALDGDKVVERAVAFVCGSQDYELSVNGVRIGRAQTYDYPGETLYQGWDITDAVVGRERLAIGVLTSYFGGAQGRAISRPGLLGRFIVYYTDGTSEVVVTDSSWLTHDTGYSNLGNRNGEGDEIEKCEAEKMLDGYSEIGYDTTGWVSVIVHGAHPTKNFYNLQPEIGHVAETTVKAVSVTTLEDGTIVADFGKVIPARVIIHFPDGVAGTEITIQEGYEILADGSINVDRESTQSTDMTYVYVMKDGEQTFEAWSYLGFRYVSVPAGVGNLTADDFEATILHAEVVEGRESTLETDSEMLNEVFEFMKRSALYSVQNQFVDTPTREKGQFLYDTINISSATTTGYYERQMTRKAILQFLNSSDRHWTSEKNSGKYTAVYPNNDGARDIPEFTLSVPMFIWRYYMLTGDLELLEYAYPYMVRTAGYVERNTDEETGLVTAIDGGTSSSYRQGIIDTPKDRFGYDWGGTLDGVRTTINAHCVRVYDVVAMMADELDNYDDATLYIEKGDALRAAMNEYLLTEEGVYCDGLTPAGVQSTNKSQHANSHAIMAGAATGETLEIVGDYIASLGMKQGTMTADILMEALFETGHGIAAANILTNINDYGWADLIDKGATFIWETWHGGSQSHGWGSASLRQLIEYISGVEITGAGASRIRINPSNGAVNSATSHTVTARGAVDISYSGYDESFVITVTIPANVTADVCFPILEGGKFVEKDGRDGKERFTSDNQIITVGSGTRTFVFEEADEEGEDTTAALSIEAVYTTVCALKDDNYPAVEPKRVGRIYY